MKLNNQVDCVKDVLSQSVIDVLEDLGWRIIACYCDEEEPIDCRYMLEIETWSDAGEDLVEDVCFDGTQDGLVDCFWRMYDNFDVDDHVEMWLPLRGKNGVPATITALLADAENIDELYGKTYHAIRDAIYSR